VQASGSGQLFVTMQTVAVTAASAGPYSVKVRHAEDDQTGTSEIAAAVDTVFAPVALGAFSVTNALPVSAALTDAQIDAAYEAALAKTKGTSSPVKQANYVLAARQSNAVRAALRQNAIDASAGGCFGRMSIVRPPLGTTKAAAMSDTQPGVGAYREQGNFYAFPGVQKKVTEIAAVGIAVEFDTALALLYPGYGATLAAFWRFEVPAPGLRYEVPGPGLRYDVPGDGLAFDVPSIGAAVTPT
jgi:hypothetical protein